MSEPLPYTIPLPRKGGGEDQQERGSRLDHQCLEEGDEGRALLVGGGDVTIACGAGLPAGCK